ncbi:hypothetical protein IWQ62_001336 [Dispira parvispora]|uniref:Uncharacterized protein n=1 Tax=Dispira parvispora TaxID=1520584 RepID=A0A9W8E8A3_9FUNG|nr:hypothetical protein IWQ62_001336 [Dispira parvispora]
MPVTQALPVTTTPSSPFSEHNKTDMPASLPFVKSRLNLSSPTDKMLSPCTKKLEKLHARSRVFKPKSLTNILAKASSQKMKKSSSANSGPTSLF